MTVTPASGVLAVCLACAALAGCASEGHEPPGELDGWRRTETWRHDDVIQFDNVATTASGNTVAWFTRGSPASNGDLAYWEKRDGKTETEIAIPVDPLPYLIPVAVATDASGWVALAATRDAPRDGNTGLRVWTGSARDDGVVLTDAALEMPSAAAPASMYAARLDGTAVVAALLDGQPAVWRLADGDAGSTAAASPGLDWPADQTLVNLRVVSDGERFVLVAVDEWGAGYIWASPDGASWEPLDLPRLPRDAGAVAIAADLGDGRIVLGWYDDEDSVPVNATAATMQLLDGSRLTDLGRIDAHHDGDNDIDRVALAGAGSSPDDRLLIVGAALRSNGTTTPMVWGHDGDDWLPSDQAELVGRLDYRFRAIARTDDGALVGLATGTRHVDVEAWRWEPDD